MKKYRIRENSPIAWARDLSVGGLMGALLLAPFALYMMGWL
jgi:hypothetical protein